MARISLHHVTKVFGTKVVAVDDLSLEVPDKGLISLLGPSGCGKTTTMRIIAGLETPTSGKVYFDGEDATDLHPRERDVAMVFQFPVLYPAMTIFDNIAFPLQARKLPKKQIRKRVNEVSETIGLSRFLYEKPKALDAGTRQRAVLARAFIRRPKVYLLDEPLTNVDPTTRVELRAELKRMHTELGQTMIYVTHDQSESLTLADKIAVIDKGKLLQYDTPECIYESPANRFVGWFIGNPGMNFINCRYQESKEKVYLEAKIFKQDITSISKKVKEASSGSDLILGIRPEHVEISPDKKIPEGIKVRCILVEPVGNRKILHLQAEDEIIKAKSSFEIKVSKGDKVWLHFPTSYLKIFDGKTYQSIV